jgi:hypothetical protein
MAMAVQILYEVAWKITFERFWCEVHIAALCASLKFMSDYQFGKDAFEGFPNGWEIGK